MHGPDCVVVHIRSEIQLRGRAQWRNGSSDRSLMMDPLSYFSLQPVLHDWYNKGCAM